MRRKLLLCFAALFFLPLVAAQQTKPAIDWKPLAWLIGDWTGAGTGSPGQGGGSFSFQTDLQEKILVRKSYAEYPATADKPAYRHDDLTIVYPEGSGFRAVYFDSEQHIIRYAVSTPDAHTIVFLSDSTPGNSGFRLTYHRTSDTSLSGKFEVAPPDKPFATYLEWTARKVTK